MVSWSSMAISYVYRNGGASRTLDVARKNNLEIVDLLSLTLEATMLANKNINNITITIGFIT